MQSTRRLGGFAPCHHTQLGFRSLFARLSILRIGPVWKPCSRGTVRSPLRLPLGLGLPDKRCTGCGQPCTCSLLPRRTRYKQYHPHSTRRLCRCLSRTLAHSQLEEPRSPGTFPLWSIDRIHTRHNPCCLRSDPVPQGTPGRSYAQRLRPLGSGTGRTRFRR